MQALLINNKVRARIKEVVDWSLANIYALDQVKGMRDGTLPIPGNRAEQICNIPYGYRVVFSVENHPGGVMKHMSVSIAGERGTLPSMESVQLIMDEFGFKTDILEKKIHHPFFAKIEDQTGQVRDHINIFEGHE